LFWRAIFYRDLFSAFRIRVAYGAKLGTRVLGNSARVPLTDAQSRNRHAQPSRISLNRHVYPPRDRIRALASIVTRLKVCRR
jgi:hypothetical protein